MWANRITLDRFVYHESAREQIHHKLDELGAMDNWITDLHIFTSNGYVGYTVTLGNETSFTVYDDGSML